MLSFVYEVGLISYLLIVSRIARLSGFTGEKQTGEWLNS